MVCAQDHHDTLKGRRIYAQLVITFRHGKEEEEMMGLSFKKELVLDRWGCDKRGVRIQIYNVRVQIYPPDKSKLGEETKLQSRLVQKLGEGAYPFSLNFPDLAPNSVVICDNEDEDPSNVGQIFLSVCNEIFSPACRGPWACSTTCGCTWRTARRTTWARRGPRWRWGSGRRSTPPST